MKRIVSALLTCIGLISIGIGQHSHETAIFEGRHSGWRSTDLRSDTFDIIHTDITLDEIDFTNKSISGHSTLTITPLTTDYNNLRLDLLKLTIDSITIDHQGTTSYVYNDTVITINLPGGLTMLDTFPVTVYYHGSPQKDASGWGGWYWSGNYAFNLGVGFAAEPHSYGRIWFPCFDNFVEKSTFSFHITTSLSENAFCNGTLLSKQLIPGSRWRYHYELGQPISSYLASVAIADYELVEWSHPGLKQVVPIRVAVRASDSGKVRNSFTHLDEALDAYEAGYGPHPFDRIGYAIIPFSGGAMEHPTNIAFPLFAINGQTTYETLMAHEFAHHWWGDYVTTATPEDMWLNEGWASWSEYWFLENVYGKERYHDEMKALHETILHLAHINDNGYRAVSGVPQDYTYGTTVYNKGADVIHTLRSYMGDTLFFQCITDFLADHPYESIDSYMFRDYLSNCSGIDLTAYFDNWIFSPGFPHFSIDSSQIVNDGQHWWVKSWIRQRLNHAPQYYDNVPLEITYMGKDFQAETQQLIMSGRCGIYYAQLNFDPAFIALDMGDKISDAITRQDAVLTTPQTLDFSEAHMTIEVNSFSQDSILLQVEHNWVAPDPFQQPHPGLHLSDYRYWRVDGLFDETLDATAVMKYDGRTNNSGYLDNNLITNKDDSLVLLYRSGPGEEWTEYSDYTNNVIGSTNKFGEMLLSKVLKGEYTLAIYDAARPDTVISDQPQNCVELNTAVKEVSPDRSEQFEVFPNPANSRLTIRFDSPAKRTIHVADIHGSNICQLFLNENQFLASLDIIDWPQGIYLISARQNGCPIRVREVSIIH